MCRDSVTCVLDTALIWVTSSECQSVFWRGIGGNAGRWSATKLSGADAAVGECNDCDRDVIQVSGEMAVVLGR